MEIFVRTRASSIPLLLRSDDERKETREKKQKRVERKKNRRERERESQSSATKLRLLLDCAALGFANVQGGTLRESLLREEVL